MHEDGVGVICVHPTAQPPPSSALEPGTLVHARTCEFVGVRPPFPPLNTASPSSLQFDLTAEPSTLAHMRECCGRSSPVAVGSAAAEYKCEWSGRGGGAGLEGVGGGGKSAATGAALATLG